MFSKKKYIGEKYSFVREESDIGHGGNGAVYYIKVFESGCQQITYPVVAKFFEYDGKDKVKRYNRFKNEVEVLSSLKGIEGIIEIIDKKCPGEVPKRKDEAWYLMPKAEKYRIDKKKSLSDKLEDMIFLAHTLQQLHKKEYAHRDIKPENMLILDGKLVLSDFGLVWCGNEERLTEMNERIGPYKIMPPELEHIQADLNLDFRPSDVYLFAKVLWMNLKSDNVGFRGEYRRGDDQIYLDKNQYGVCTLEPIHKLIERATYEDMNSRISIKECIDYLLLQKHILDETQSLPGNLLKKLQYEEESKRITEKSNPDEYVYRDKRVIYEMLRNVIPNAVVFVKSSGEQARGEQIKITNCVMKADGVYQFLFYFNGKKVNEYLANIEKMKYIKNEECVELELGDLTLEEPDYVLYGGQTKLLGSMLFKGYFSAKHRIVISKE